MMMLIQPATSSLMYDESTDQTITATQANDMAVTGTWYHLTATFNGGVAGAAGDAKLYVDGVVNSSALNASFLGLEDVTSDFTIVDYDADDVVATDTAFTGTIDEVMVTAETLSIGQVKQIYEVGKRAKQMHNTSADTDDDGSNDVDDLQQLQNGEDDVYAIAVDDGNQAIFVAQAMPMMALFPSSELIRIPVLIPTLKIIQKLMIR